MASEKTKKVTKSSAKKTTAKKAPAKKKTSVKKVSQKAYFDSSKLIFIAIAMMVVLVVAFILINYFVI